MHFFFGFPCAFLQFAQVIIVFDIDLRGHLMFTCSCVTCACP